MMNVEIDDEVLDMAIDAMQSINNEVYRVDACKMLVEALKVLHEQGAI